MASIYLIPSLLGDGAPIECMPLATLTVIRRLDHFVVETPKVARAHLRAAGVTLSDGRLTIRVLDEHTPEHEVESLLAPVKQGHDLGVLTDAGCPGVADPGARLVRIAHSQAIPVIPLVGPSAILLALMASGLEGQRFIFHGYLPIEAGARASAINSIEAQSRRLMQTQIFIEAPYRNRRLFDALIAHCDPETLLCVATHLTMANETISTQSIRRWRSTAPPLVERRPTVFLLFASP